MGKKRKWIQAAILIAVLIIAGLTMANSMKTEHKVPRAGDKAPDFTLAGLDGAAHKLSDYRGKTVVVNFWGTFCPPCKEEMPAIQRQYEKWQSAGVVVLGVNLGESPITAKGFADQVKATFPIVIDHDDETRRKYGVTEFPTTFFVDPDGKITTVKVGGMEEAVIDQTLASMVKK